MDICLFFYLEKGWLFLTGLLVFFLELCTFPFMEEYSVRPNRLFVEYLVYPEELIKLMLRGHLTAVVAVTALMTEPIIVPHKGVSNPVSQ